MFNYEQNANLTRIHQQERIDEGERSRIAAETQPRQHIYGAVFVYALRKCAEWGQKLRTQPEQIELPRTSTQEMAAVR